MKVDRRWPKSIHCQAEAAFQSIRAFGAKKADAPDLVRSIGTWKLYRAEAHAFCRFLQARGCSNLLDSDAYADGLGAYLRWKLDRLSDRTESLQTYETLVSALAKLEYAVNTYAELHQLPGRLDMSMIRQDYLRAARKLLPVSSTPYDNRAFPDPESLISAIPDETHQLQAQLQLEGGFRAEGMGAPSGKLRNPLKPSALLGVVSDPVTGNPVGVIATKEKGGKVTSHYVSVGTYERLQEYLVRYGVLESDYKEYLAAVNEAAVQTGQYCRGRGSHGLKHSFAQRRFRQCVAHGLTQDEAMHQVSRELSRFRPGITLTYTRGQKQ